MKALTVRQPHAGRIANGVKPIETRDFSISYRGRLLICAGQELDLQVARRTSAAEGISPAEFMEKYPTGVAVAMVTLWDCVRFRPDQAAAACTPWRDKAWAWLLKDVVKFARPFAARGMPGLFDLAVTDDQLQGVR